MGRNIALFVVVVVVVAGILKTSGILHILKNDNTQERKGASCRCFLSLTQRPTAVDWLGLFLPRGVCCLTDIMRRIFVINNNNSNKSLRRAMQNAAGLTTKSLMTPSDGVADLAAA